MQILLWSSLRKAFANERRVRGNNTSMAEETSTTEFDERTQTRMDLVLNETCRELPQYGGDHETRKYIAEHLIDAARSGQTELADLRATARRAMLQLRSGKPAQAPAPEPFNAGSRRLLAKSPLGPEEIDILVKAYEETLRALHLVDRNDPITEMVAKKVIEIGQTGPRDPAQISARAIKELTIS
jgi:hypothetical protein